MIPKPCGQREKVIHEDIRVVSNSMRQAVKRLHSTDSMLNYNPRSCLFSVLFSLFDG